MKLFQIEEPEGAPVDRDAPGVAVGIGLGPEPEVAIAVGGNAEVIGRAAPGEAVATLLALRGAAEKTLARPVTHAVIASDAAVDAAAAGMVLLRLVPASTGALGAARLAEDLAPRPA